MADIRVRFAPSPTGYLHIGGARTALFNYLFARKHGGKFVLRVEDTDTERTVKDSAEKMMEAFQWLGLNWDEGPIVGGPAGPYYQSERAHFYKKYAEYLVKRGHAYPCYCTPEELARDRQRAREEKRAPRYSGRCRELTDEQKAGLEGKGVKPCLRFKTPDAGTTCVRDLIHGEVVFQNEEIADFVIMKSDGLPTYNFACVVDDWLMGITHVIRAEEHLSNTPKQMMMYEALSAPMPKFAHVPMILAPDRAKLSKRHGAQTVEEFKEKGYLPQALLNYVAFLGWTPADSTQEILSLQDMIDEFDLERVSLTPAVYDVQKLTWMNGQYIRAMDVETLADMYIPLAAQSGFCSLEDLSVRKEWVYKVVAALQERSKTTNEMVEASEYFFLRPQEYDAKGERKFFGKPGTPELLEKGAAVLAGIARWNLEAQEAAYRELIEREGIKGGELIHPSRLALTGKTVGPGLFHIMDILGQEETVARLLEAAQHIRGGDGS